MICKLPAELVGTFWLVLGGGGSAVLAAGAADVGIGWLGVSLAFGLTVLTMAYAVGHISSGHFNPAVTLGLVMAGRHEAKGMVPYWVAQVVGAALGALVLYLIASGAAGFAGVGGFATNGFGKLSPQGYSMVAVIVTEIAMTAAFLIIILGATSKGAPAGFGPIAIGLGLILIHLISIPVSNTSVNPARSTGVAIFAETGALGQLWVFWVAPLVGAALGAIIWWLMSDDRPKPQKSGSDEPGFLQQAQPLGLVIIALGVPHHGGIHVAVGNQPGTAQVFARVDQVGFGIQQAFGAASISHACGGVGVDLHQAHIRIIPGPRAMGAFPHTNLVNQFARYFIVIGPCVDERSKLRRFVRVERRVEVGI